MEGPGVDDVALSENQCGMETLVHTSTFDVCWLSENQCGMETDDKKKGALRRLVEREPMWDGNMKGDIVDAEAVR